MTLLRNVVLLSAVITIALVVGCTDEHLGPQPDVRYESSDPEEPAAKRAFFTGRDSFGVSFRAQGFGTWSILGNGCRELRGTGTATHLGRISFTHQLCTDASDEVTEGELSIRGTTGGTLMGYTLPGGALLPTGERVRVSLTDKINGGDIRATHVPSESGRATVTGVLRPDGEFSYRLEGWLLHHVRDE